MGKGWRMLSTGIEMLNFLESMLMIISKVRLVEARSFDFWPRASSTNYASGGIAHQDHQ